jgi:hypothetical protein
MLKKLGGRKVLGCLIVGLPTLIVLLCVGKISSGDFITGFIADLTLFVGGNVVSKFAKGD